MNGKTPILDGLAAHAGDKIAFRHLLFLALFLALALASAAPMTPAGAAPAGQGVTVSSKYFFQITPPKRPVCAGENRYIGVRVRHTRRFPGLKLASKQPEDPFAGIQGVRISSLNTNESVGVLQPTAWTSGDTEADEIPASGSVFKALKEGTTELSFEATIPPAQSGGKLAYILSAPLQLEVVNCDYTVVMQYAGTLTHGMSGDPPVPTDVKGSGVTGEIGLKRKEGTQDYEGYGFFNLIKGVSQWAASNPVLRVACSATHALKTGTIHITGTLANGTLALKINYDPQWTVDSRAVCNGIGNPTDSRSTNSPKPTDAEFSESGGVQAYDITWGDGFTGKLTIFVASKVR